MNEPTEIQLMRFADGDLDAETNRWVASVVAQRPDLAHKVAIYQATGRGLGNIVAEGIPERPDDDLERQILAYPVARSGAVPAARSNGGARPRIEASEATGSRGGTVVQFPGQASARASRRPSTPSLVLAASVAALVAGALAMTMLEWRSTTGGAPGTKVADNTSLNRETGKATSLTFAALAGALEIAPSNKTMAIQGGWIVKPILTFVARDDRYCREYKAGHATGSNLWGVACRATSGNWQNMAQAPTEVSLFEDGRGAGPAGGLAPSTVEEEVGRLRDLDKDVIGGEEEAKLIARRWK